MTLPITLALTAALLAAAVFAGWRGARPPDPRKGPRLAPWRFLMTLFAAGALLLAAHVVALLRGEG